MVVGDAGILSLAPILFMGPGLYVLFRSLRRLRVERSYPTVHLKPSKIPVAPGERFECVLHSGADPARFSASNVTFNVRITANKWVVRSSAGDRGPRKVRSVVWEKSTPVVAASGTSELGSSLIGRFSFDLPEELEETSRVQAVITYDWRLEVDATDSLPGFHYEFELPVFDTRTALEKADHALGTATNTEPATDVEESTPATAFRPPVGKGDLDGLKAYQDDVFEERCARDSRPTSQRIFRAMEPYTHIERLGDRAVSVVHVKGDRAVRRIRRVASGAAVLLMFFVPGDFRLLFFFAALLLLAMGASAKPNAIAMHADDTGLHIDTVRGRKKGSRHHVWSSVGMIHVHRYSSSDVHDIVVGLTKDGTRSIGARFSSKGEAEGIAAAIAAVKERHI